MASSPVISLNHLSIVPSQLLQDLVLRPSTNLFLLKNPNKLNDAILKQLLEKTNIPIMTELPASIDKIKNEDLSSQLFSAVRTNKIDLSLKLIKSGADVNFVNINRDNMSVLHMAVASNQISQVELLFLNEVNLEVKNVKGETAEDLALQLGHHEIANRLLDYKYLVSDYLIRYLSNQVTSYRQYPDLISDINHVEQINFIVAYKPDPETITFFDQLEQESFKNIIIDLVDFLQYSNLRKTNKEILPKRMPENEFLSVERDVFRQSLSSLKIDRLLDLINDVIYCWAKKCGESCYLLNQTSDNFQNQNCESSEIAKETISKLEKFEDKILGLEKVVLQKDQEIQNLTRKLKISEGERLGLQNKITELARRNELQKKLDKLAITNQSKSESNNSISNDNNNQNQRLISSDSPLEHEDQLDRLFGDSTEPVPKELKLSVNVKATETSVQLSKLMSAYKSQNSKSIQLEIKYVSKQVKEFVAYFKLHFENCLNVSQKARRYLNDLEKNLDELVKNIFSKEGQLVKNDIFIKHCYNIANFMKKLVIELENFSRIS